MIKKLIISISLLLSNTVFANTLAIVPFAPGGAIDKVAREFSLFVKEKTGENIVVENRLGAGSIVATNVLLSTERPNNTLLITSNSFFTNIVEEKFQREEFRSVSILGINPYVLVTSNSKNLSCTDLKDKNKKFFVGTAGKGSATDSAAEILVERYPNITIVPYKGVAQALTDLIPGRIDLGITSGLRHRDTVKPIATTTTTDLYRGISNWKSCLGIDVDYQGEYLIVAHSSASDEFVNRINVLASEFVRQPNVIEKFSQDGIQPMSYNLKDTDLYFTNSLKNWKKLLKKN